MALKTDYKDFIPVGETRVFNIKKEDGTIIESSVELEDATIYEQEGNIFGASDINLTNNAINLINDDISLINDDISITIPTSSWVATTERGFSYKYEYINESISGDVVLDFAVDELHLSKEIIEEQRAVVGGFSGYSDVGKLVFLTEEQPEISLNILVRGVRQWKT